MASTTFFVVNLPNLPSDNYTIDSELVRRLAEKTRELRLHALKTAPEAFGSSYETEIERGLEQTIEKLKTPQADHFFVVDRRIVPWSAGNNDMFFQTLLEAKWVGMMVLIGPLTSSGSLAISSKRDPLSLYARADADDATKQQHTSTSELLHYHLNGVFVDPEHQRAGLGKALIEAALGRATEEATTRGQDLHCTVLVNTENTSAYNLYEKLGFRATGEETYLQQPRLRMGQLRSEERVAVKMELTSSVS